MKTELPSPTDQRPSMRAVPSAQPNRSVGSMSDAGADFDKGARVNRDKGSRMNRIAKRAHEIYESRGGEHGKALNDWLQAEREIDAED